MVTLVGGPMAGWIVPPNAPALHPDWYRTWPVLRRGWFARLLRRPRWPWPGPGRYVVDGATAVWKDGAP
jgi:hypothetical protein